MRHIESYQKLSQRCFDNNLWKTLLKNIIENITGQILLVVNLIVGLSSDS